MSDVTPEDFPEAPVVGDTPTANGVSEIADEHRRIVALDYAGRVNYNGIDDYLRAADKVNTYLRTGKISEDDTN
jgi:putative N-acetylmannosamine-6-phosphate epimerase